MTTCHFRSCPGRTSGSTVRPDGIELLYCVAHEAIARNLPPLRSAGCCASEGCGRPRGQRSPLCKSCRPRYSAWGLDGHIPAQEAPMTEPTPPSKLPELGFPRVQIQTSGASLADLEAAATGATTPTPLAAPQDAADGGATPSPEAVADFLLTAKSAAEVTGADFEPPATVEDFLRDLESGDGEPSEGDVADAPLFVGGTDSAPELVARWGQVHTAPLDGLAALAARGQQPTAPGPTLAEVQAELERELAAVTKGRDRLWEEVKAETARADAAELDAVQERARADEAMEELAAIAAMLDPEDAPAYDSDDQPIPLPVRVQTALMPDTAYERELRKSLHAVEAELFEVDRTLQHLGAYGNGPTIDQLLKVLTPEDRRNILELQAAEARLDLARLRARRLNPAPPEKLAEYAAKVAALDARIAALDAG